MKVQINPNKEKRVKITQAIKDNDGYCPCKLTRDKDNRCICKEFRESEELGWCHCGLYYKSEI